jgi:hypothetical protein
MARGWESKSVEDQMASAEESKASSLKPILSAELRELQARKDGLLLSRTRVARDIENAKDDRHRVVLQRALDYIDAQIERL